VITATSGTQVIALTGGTIAAAGSCTFSVNATATTSGVKDNTAGPVTSTEGGAGNTATASITVNAPVGSPSVTNPPLVSPMVRIAGGDAIATGIAVSQASFPNPGTARAVVLARSDFYSDALAGGPFAAAKNGPLLITPGAPAGLDDRVRAEIQRVLPGGGTVYLLGGPLALSPDIDTTLSSLGFHPVRVAGPNLYATAIAIAEQLGNPGIIFEATGLDFADALSAVPAAIRSHGAIVLTNGSAQSPETAAYLAAHPFVLRYAIGGPLAAAGADPGANPIYGPDLYATSAAVANQFFSYAVVFGAATGLNYPDALTGGVFMATGGRNGAMLLVTTNPPIPALIATYLHTLRPGTPGYVFGGPLAITDTTLTALQAAVGP
jgi:putative cell wall-binding protein